MMSVRGDLPNMVMLVSVNRKASKFCLWMTANHRKDILEGAIKEASAKRVCVRKLHQGPIWADQKGSEN